MQELTNLLESQFRFARSQEVSDLGARRWLFRLGFDLFANTKFCKDLDHVAAARS
jgi:hypothetical protein